MSDHEDQIAFDKWSKCVDLYMYHDQLAQKRLAHALTIQFGLFVAFYSLLSPPFHQDSAPLSSLAPLAPFICAVGAFVALLYCLAHGRAHRFRMIYRDLAIELECRAFAEHPRPMTHQTLKTSGGELTATNIEKVMFGVSILSWGLALGYSLNFDLDGLCMCVILYLLVLLAFFVFSFRSWT